MNNRIASVVYDRVRGAAFSLMSGDAIGSIYEGVTASEVEVEDTFSVMLKSDALGLLPGQIAGDSEMLITLAKSISSCGHYQPESALNHYQRWKETSPFDIGDTVAASLSHSASRESQDNGALVRSLGLAMMLVESDESELLESVRMDTVLTHPNDMCIIANELLAYVMQMLLQGKDSNEIKERITDPTSVDIRFSKLNECIRESFFDKPVCDGQVTSTLQHALYQLWNANTIEEGIVDTVECGGTSDTNSAIVGGLLGAKFGFSKVPSNWVSTLLGCQPKISNHNAFKPRPKWLWPSSLIELLDIHYQREDEIEDWHF
jgi:ADP-ribosyl-[dinitrogen reductase] hydrolase